jgi:sugar phosphate isomerase/epimerase
MDTTPARAFTEVGNGSINFKEIFAQRAVAGLEQYYVEQDRCKDHSPMESAKISINYLKKSII